MKYQRIEGVLQVVAGYSGGNQRSPTYDEVFDHSEALWIEYNPSQVSLETLLLAWTSMHKPENPVPRQYRSAMWYLNEDQRAAGETIVEKWRAQHKERVEDERSVLYTTVEQATKFYRAESYHQDYYIRTGQARFVR